MSNEHEWEAKYDRWYLIELFKEILWHKNEHSIQDLVDLCWFVDRFCYYNIEQIEDEDKANTAMFGQDVIQRMITEWITYPSFISDGFYRNYVNKYKTDDFIDNYLWAGDVLLGFKEAHEAYKTGVPIEDIFA